MSFVIAVPEAFGAAATDMANIGSTLDAANAATSARTTGVLAAAADEVPVAIAGLFCGHGQGYQELSAQAAAFHEQFAQALTAASGSYAATEAANEAANASPLQVLLNLINTPTQALTGRPLILLRASTSRHSRIVGSRAAAG